MPKQVIQIDVEDQSFKSFVEAFKKFQQALGDAQKKLDELGKKSEEAAKKGQTSFEKFRKEIDALNRSSVSMLTPLAKMGSIMFDIAKSAASTALSFAKWLAFGAIGSGFGLGALASNVVSTGGQARSLGITSGQLRSAKVAYGKFDLDVEGLLSRINEVKRDPSRWSAFQGLGITDFKTASPVDILAEVLQKGKGRSAQILGNQGILNQVSPIISQSELLNLQGLNQNDLAQAAKQQKSLTGKYETSDKGWQQFYGALQDAGQTIETSLIKNLSVLTPALSEMAHVISDDINKFLSSPNFKQGMKNFSDMIMKFAMWMGSKDFEKDIYAFAKGVKEATQTLYDAIVFLKHPFQNMGAAAGNWLYDVTHGNKSLTDTKSTSDLSAIYKKTSKETGFPEKAIGYEATGLLAEDADMDTLSYRLNSQIKALKAIMQQFDPKESSPILKALIAYGQKDTTQAIKDLKGTAVTQTKLGKDYLAAHPDAWNVNGLRVIVNDNTGSNANLTLSALGATR